jgi:hypothetical protein
MFVSMISTTVLTLALIAGATEPRKDDLATRKAFNARIGEYLKLRSHALQGIPPLKPKADPEQIQARKLAVARAISEARSGVPQGTVFTPEVRDYILDIVRSEMRGKQGVPAKEAVKQGNPATETPAIPVPLRVNAPYPDKAPLSTAPPTLLLRLPELPKELDFRFVGRNLILRDVDAGLIVDFIPNAAP